MINDDESDGANHKTDQSKEKIFDCNNSEAC